MHKSNRRERRAEKFKNAKVVLVPDSSAKSSPKTTLLAWLRSGGISSILLGGFGLMRTFYLPSVVAIYLGFLLLSLDALCEKLHILFKAAIIVSLASLAVLFTKDVVVHKSPMQYEYRVIGGDELEMSIRNDSLEDDYRS